jgi:GNAT superfamily N-acetyltransferase
VTVRVRAARPDEIDATTHLLATAFEQYRHELPVFDKYMSHLADVGARMREAETFVALVGERIVGTGTLYPPGRGDAYRRGAAPEMSPAAWPDEWSGLRLLGVDPAYRRAGIGRLLMDARIRRARELGATAVALHTSRTFDASRTMVERMGWVRMPAYDFYPQPDLCAETWMLALPPS